MANINGAFGLRPVAKLGQAANSTGTSGYTPYEIASGNSNVIYHGSPVKAFVEDDPNTLFVIATDASWTNKATARAAVFANANFATGTSGSTTNGMSSATLGISTINTTNSLHLRIMGWVDDPSNADFSAAGIGAVVHLQPQAYRRLKNGY